MRTTKLKNFSNLRKTRKDFLNFMFFFVPMVFAYGNFIMSQASTNIQRLHLQKLKKTSCIRTV